MYNGIGLQTARGSGTNGYVQANLSSLLLAKKKIEYNCEDDMKRMEAEINKAPNEDLLNHQRKRQVEMKCVEFEMLMEDKGFDDDEIQKKVSDYRKLLLSQLESGELNLDDELDTRDSHARRQYASKSRDRMRDALGLKKDYVPGSSMEKMNKTDVVGAALEATPVVDTKTEMINVLKEMKKSKKTKKSQKKKRRDSSSSSSSSDSDSSDSDSDSDSDSSSSSSDDEKKKKSKERESKGKNIEKDKKKERRRSPDLEDSRKSDRNDRKRKSDRDERRKKSPERDERRRKSPERDERRRKSPERDERRRRSPERDERRRSSERDDSKRRRH